VSKAASIILIIHFLDTLFAAKLSTLTRLVLDEVKVVTRSQPHAFHGLEIPVKTLAGARALRIVHPAGQVIQAHRHDWPLLTLPALGGYEEESDEGSIAVAGPAVVLHPAGRCHANCIHQLGMETFSIEFDPAWIGLSRRDRLIERSRYWIGGPVTLASRALARLWSDPAASEDEIRRSTEEFLEMARKAAVSPQPAWLARARRQLSVDQATTAARIAESLGMHPRWLAHAYRRAAGEGLHDTVRRNRAEQAAHLLRSTDSPIAEIAFATGFCDQSHLSRVLGHFTGRTPLQIRAEREQLSRLLAS
jgi:AraC family transcriptional regulator